MNFLVISIDQPNVVHLGDGLNFGRVSLVRLLLSLRRRQGRLADIVKDQFVRQNFGVRCSLGYSRRVMDFMRPFAAGLRLIEMRRHD